MAGVLLPVANILQALSNAGAVLSGGKLYTYVAGTTTNQATYKEQALSNQHANPIVLDSAGRLESPVWATAGNTFKLVFKTSADVQIGPTWDNIAGINDTSALGVQYWAGTAGGTANVLTLTFSSGPAAYGQGNVFIFKAASTNTGSATVNANGLGAKTFKKENDRDLVGGEIIADRWHRATYDGTYMRLEAMDGPEGIRVDVLSAATVNLDTADSQYVRITGTTGISAITLADGRECEAVFGDALEITHGASLLCPGSASIKTYAGMTLRFRGEASGVVRVIVPGNAADATAARVDVASVAGTTVLDTAGGNYVRITGTNTITAFTLANGRWRNVLAGGAFSVTTGASLIFTGLSSGTTLTLAAGDTFRIDGESGGVVRISNYTRANDGADGLYSTTTASGAATADIVLPSGFRRYEIVFDGTVATDGAELTLRISQDGGSTFKSGAANYEYVATTIDNSGATAVAISTGDTEISIAQTIGNASTESFAGNVVIHNAASAAIHKLIQFTSSNWDNTATPLIKHMSGVGSYNADANAINAVRFLASSGNISGTFKLYVRA